MSRLLIATFTEAGDVVRATRAARERGYDIVDVYTPFAVHGLDEAMGLPQSRLTWVCFFGGVVGVSVGMGFEIWSSAVSWPLNIGGKPLHSIPAFVPVAFEMTILLAGLSVFFATLLRCGLLPWRKAKLIVPRITDDRFAIVLAHGAAFSRSEVEELFMGFGAVAIEEREEGQS